jgi:hypothetical protein
MNKDEAFFARDLAAMTTKSHSSNGSRPPESQVRLQQAVRTLRAIRQRYEMGRNVDSDYVRAYSLQVALGYADMFWITAAIEALEKAIVDEAKPTDAAADAQPKT